MGKLTQTVLYWWPIVNFDKVNQWGGLLQLGDLFLGRINQIALKVPLTIHFIHQIIYNLRLDIFGPLFIFILLGCVFNLKQLRNHFRQATKQTKIALLVCSSFLLLMACLSLIIGRDQEVSFYRFTSFTYAPALCLAMLLIATFLSEHKKWTSFILLLGCLYAFSAVSGDHAHYSRRFLIELSIFTIFLLILLDFIFDLRKIRSKFISAFISKYAFRIFLGFALLVISPLHYPRNFFRVISRGTRFITGQYSIAEAYQDQRGWPGRTLWGGIYPPMEIIWSLLPPKTRVWSWHIHSYCMLPDCNVEGFTSFQMSPHENIVYFGDPQKAKEILKAENLNYFFFSTQLDIRDPLSRAPLFSPEHIADYLGIAWTDGDNTLLTWKEQAQRPIDVRWLNTYSKHIEESSPRYPYNVIKKIFEFSDTEARDRYLKSKDFRD